MRRTVQPARARRWTWAVGAVLLIAGIVIAGARSTPRAAEGRRSAVRAPRAGVEPVEARRASASIAGRVSAGGLGLGGASVCATSSFGGLAEREAACAVSAPDGGYRIDGAPAGKVEVRASAVGHRPAMVEADARVDRTAAGVDLFLEAGGVELRGRVLDLEGRAVRGAIVVATSEEPWRAASTAVGRAGEAGEFSVWLAPGDAVVKAGAPGHAEEKRGALAPSAGLEIFLGPESVIAGQVRDAASGEPIAGAQVSLADAGQLPMKPAAPVAISDDEGRFEVHGLPPGRYLPAATSAGARGVAGESIELGLGEHRREVSIEVRPAAEVRGRVLITPGDQPCTEGKVTLRAQTGAEAWESPIDGAGQARFEAMSIGRYDVLVDCARGRAQRAPITLEVSRAEVVMPVWRAVEGLEIRGRLIDEAGRPVPGLVSAAYPVPYAPANPPAVKKAWARPDGSYTLAGLEADNAFMLTGEVEPRLGGASGWVDLKDESKDGQDLVVSPSEGTGRLLGTIVDEAGAPVSGVLVTLGVVSTEARAVTGEDGAFAFSKLGSGYTAIMLSRELGAPLDASRWDKWMETSVGEGEVTQLRLVVPTADRVIRGEVKDASGQPIAGAVVEAERELDVEGHYFAMSTPSLHVHRGWLRRPAVSDEAGNVTLEGLTAGRYTVRAYPRGGGTILVEHAEAGAPALVDLVLRRAGSIEGVVGLGGGAASSIALRVTETERGASRSARPDPDGAFTVTGLPAGRYRVTAEGPEGTAEVEVTLSEGERRAGLRLALVTRTTLKGRLVDAVTGEAVEERLRAAPWRFGAAVVPPALDPDGWLDKEGRFELPGVPAGWVMLRLGSFSGPIGTYDWCQFLVRAEPRAVTDLGVIRVTGVGDGRDLGLEMRSLSPADRDDRWVVGTVTPGGPADLAGLSAGDVVVSIDGKPLRDWPVRYFYDDLRRVPSGVAVTLGLASGARVGLGGPP